MTDAKEKKTILIIASFEQGRGSGHLARSAVLANELRARGIDAHLYIPSLGTRCGRGFNDAKIIIEQAGISFDDIPLILDEEKIARPENGDRSCPPQPQWSLFVFDRFKTEIAEFDHFKYLAPQTVFLAIDENGEGTNSLRNQFDFLLDLLPNPSHCDPNLLAPAFLSLPENKAEKKFAQFERSILEQGEGGASKKINVLVSFGSEDAAGLGAAAASAAAAPGLVNVDFISGALTMRDGAIVPEPNANSALSEAWRRNTAVNTNINAKAHIKNLKEHLAEYDLLITHFGLSAFEALAAGVPVILLSPTAYHQKTARAAGFLTATAKICPGGLPAAKKLQRLLFLDVGKTILNIDFLNTLAKRCAALAKKYKLDEDADLGGTKSLAEFIGALEPEVPSSCPVCGSERGSSGKTAHSVIGRFFDRSYRACSVCGMIYLNRTHPPAIEYSESYFFENYKKQYGKTYLEDFPNLIAMAERRLSIIKTILTENDGSKPAANKGKIAAKKSDAPQTLLDIGCAYGAFLAVARDVGFAPRGIDISSDAARYANETLGLDVQTCNFPVDNLPGDEISVITLWYVIEHVADVKTALLKIKNSLAQGGVLAFSTPSASGISARKSMRQFLQNSPADHRIILYPRLMRRLLSCYGFDTKKIVISGHHPERFPLIGKYLKNKSSAIYKFCMAISRIFRLGDTFEVYAIKI